MRYIVALLLKLFLPLAAANAAEATCPGFDGPSASPSDVHRFYGLRAVAIVRAALENNVEELRGLVSPDARFGISHGDYGTSGRLTGIAGAIRMARDLAPHRYSIAIAPTVSIRVLADSCEWTSTVRFETRDGSAGVVMDFRFTRGVLTSALGHSVELVEGDIR